MWKKEGSRDRPKKMDERREPLRKREMGFLFTESREHRKQNSRLLDHC